MRIDFRMPREWAQANEWVAKHLPAGSNAEPLVFQTVQAAAIEAAYGLSQMFPQKKKVFFIKNCDPTFDVAAMVLAKMGYMVTGLDTTVLEDPTHFASIIERDALLVLYAADDPILGRRFPTEKLEAALKEKALIQVRVSHNAHFYSALKAETPRTGVHIYSLKSGGAVALCGERARFGVLTADQIVPPTLLAAAPIDLSWMTQAKVEAREKVLAFEKKSVGDAKPVLTGERVYDRAVISWGDLDGHTMITRLAEKLKITLQPPGVESRLETTSLSRWSGVRTFDFLKSLNFSPEILRGLIMVSADLLTADFEAKLTEARREILADQFGGTKWSTPTA